MTTFDITLNNLCSAEFTCTYEESAQFWRNIEEKCANELTTYVDWSATPSSLEQNQHTVIASYGSLLFFYFAVPEHNSICYKSSSGGKFNLLQFGEKKECNIYFISDIYLVFTLF